jgi:hypothetical protein
MIRQLVVVFLAAFAWAKMEVEIEGEHGWAKNLPTWRLNHPILIWLMNGRPLTGYHFWAFTFVFFIFHLPPLWTNIWSWQMECRIMGSVTLFWVVEDFLWFVVNPHYGLNRHKNGQIWWHKKWLWGFPSDHWGMVLMGTTLLALSCR